MICSVFKVRENCKTNNNQDSQLSTISVQTLKGTMLTLDENLDSTTIQFLIASKPLIYDRSPAS
jgi:hypothetical protein